MRIFIDGTSSRTFVFATLGLAGLLALAGCGAQSGSSNTAPASHAFAMKSTSATAATSSAPALSSLRVSTPSVSAGSQFAVTVTLAQPAPEGGVNIPLTASEPDIVDLPTSLEVATGQTSATATVSAKNVSEAHSVSVRAQSDASMAGTSVSVVPVTPVPFQADSVAAAVPLNAAIPASGPNANFKGCWYREGKNRYQAVDVTVGHPGTYTFNAVLYHGTTCNPKDWADQFGFGEQINFGDSGYIFWFTAFANQADMSALWYVGGQKSQCVNYRTAPSC